MLPHRLVDGGGDKAIEGEAHVCVCVCVYVCVCVFAC